MQCVSKRPRSQITTVVRALHPDARPFAFWHMRELAARRVKAPVKIPPVIRLRDLAKQLRMGMSQMLPKLAPREAKRYLYVDPTGAEYEFKNAGDVAFERECAEEICGVFGVPHVSEEVDLSPSVLPRDPPKEGQARRRAVAIVMGHIDHGKTTLVDAVCGTNVAPGEAGGITQTVYTHELEGSGDSAPVTILDTPGHAHFFRMREDSAAVADAGLLVVAADQGMGPQTEEAVQCLLDMNIPVLALLTKVDLPVATHRLTVPGLRRELLARGLNPLTVLPVSAVDGTNLDTVRRALSTVVPRMAPADDPGRPMEGFVLDSRVDGGRGLTASVLVRCGVLRVGDSFIVGRVVGRVRSITAPDGSALKSATAGRLVRIDGIKRSRIAREAPPSGEAFFAVPEDVAVRVADYRELLLTMAAACVRGTPLTERGRPPVAAEIAGRVPVPGGGRVGGVGGVIGGEGTARDGVTATAQDAGGESDDGYYDYYESTAAEAVGAAVEAAARSGSKAETGEYGGGSDNGYDEYYSEDTGAEEDTERAAAAAAPGGAASAAAAAGDIEYEYEYVDEEEEGAASASASASDPVPGRHSGAVRGVAAPGVSRLPPAPSAAGEIVTVDMTRAGAGGARGGAAADGARVAAGEAEAEDEDEYTYEYKDEMDLNTAEQMSVLAQHARAVRESTRNAQGEALSAFEMGAAQSMWPSLRLPPLTGDEKLPLVVRTDSAASFGTLHDVLEGQLPVKIAAGGIGHVSTIDLEAAAGLRCPILCYNVQPGKGVEKEAKRRRVTVHRHDILHELVVRICAMCEEAFENAAKGKDRVRKTPPRDQ